MNDNNQWITREEQKEIKRIHARTANINKRDIEKSFKENGIDINAAVLKETALTYYGFIHAAEELNLETYEEIYCIVFPPTEADVIAYRKKAQKDLIDDDGNAYKDDELPRWVIWDSEGESCEICQQYDKMLMKRLEVPYTHPNCDCKLIAVSNDDPAVQLYEDYFATHDMPIKRDKIAGANHAFYVLDLYRSSKKATDEVLFVYGNTEDGTRQNALRHALWNALMTQIAGYDVAKEVADAHEVLPQDSLNDIYRGFRVWEHINMDLFFNELGRQSYLELKNEQQLGLVDEITIEMLINCIEDNIDQNKDMILNQEQADRKH